MKTDTWGLVDQWGYVFRNQARATRELRGWTQSRLSEELLHKFGFEIHQTAITRMENGEREVRFGEALAISSALGMDLTHFIPNHEDNFARATIHQMKQVLLGAIETLDGLVPHE